MCIFLLISFLILDLLLNLYLRWTQAPAKILSVVSPSEYEEDQDQDEE
jgi:hypothetical protein